MYTTPTSTPLYPLYLMYTCRENPEEGNSSREGTAQEEKRLLASIALGIDCAGLLESMLFQMNIQARYA